MWCTFEVVIGPLQAGLKRDAPVLFLSECVLVYLQVLSFSIVSLLSFIVTFRLLVVVASQEKAMQLLNGLQASSTAALVECSSLTSKSIRMMHLARWWLAQSSVLLTITLQRFHCYCHHYHRADIHQVMMRNLVTRGCPLHSLQSYPDLQAQKMR
jgi:hypothetical protein